MDEKTIKITFVDPHSNNEVEIFTSGENARRAETDPEFANVLFSKVRRKCASNSGDSKSPNHIDFSLECETVIEESPLLNNTQGNEGPQCRWTPACVMFLLDMYKKYEHGVSAGKLSNKKLCNKLADKLQTQGFMVTGLQCGSKLRSLKRTYKSIKDNNEKSVDDRKPWEFFDKMEDVFGGKPWCNPVSVFSSSSFCSRLNENLNKKETNLFTDAVLKIVQQECNSDNDRKPIQNEFSLENENIITNSPLSDNGEENGGHLYRWTTPCVLLLLEKYRKYTSTAVKISNKKLCKRLSEDLKSQGYMVTGPQCSSKLRSLRKTYKSIKDHNTKRPNERRSWEFFDQMEEIFGGRAWSNPVAIFSSDSLCSNQNNINSQETGATISTETKSVTRSEASLASLLKQRIQQKEKHEAQKADRHAERKRIIEATLSIKAKSRETQSSLLKQRIQQKEEHESRKAKRHAEKMELARKRLKMDEDILKLLKQ